MPDQLAAERPTAPPRRDLLLKALFAAACCAALYLRLEIFIWPVLWPLVGAGALAWGGWEERLGFLAFLATLAVTRQVFGLQAPSAAVLLVDAAFLAALALIAVRSRRWWPSWAAAFQLAAVATRLIFLAPTQTIEFHAYLVSLTIWTWLVFVALAFGAWDRWRARAPEPAAPLRAWIGAAAFGAMAAFACWYVWPALPGRLAELGAGSRQARAARGPKPVRRPSPTSPSPAPTGRGAGAPAPAGRDRTSGAPARAGRSW